MGLRPTTNTIRYITGFLTGTAAGSIIAPLLFALRTDAAPSERIFGKPTLALLHLLATFALGTIFFVIYPFIGIASSLFAVLAFLVLLMSVNVIIVTLVKPLPVPHKAWHWLLVLALCLVLSLVEITVFGLAREMIVQTVLRGHEFSEFLR
jgi:hypothetical protein